MVQFDYPSRRDLRQQSTYVPTHPFLPTSPYNIHNLGANCLRLQEPDEEVIEVRPLPIDLPSDRLSRRVFGDKEIMRDVDRNLLETPLLGCDGFEYRDDPPDAQCFAPEHDIFELFHFREVDQSRPPGVR